MTVTRFMPRQDYAVGCLKKGGGALGKNADALKRNIARKEYSFIPENSASQLGNAFITLNFISHALYKPLPIKVVIFISKY